MTLIFALALGSGAQASDLRSNDAFVILGISKDLSRAEMREQAKQSYRRLAKKYHPDLLGDSTSSEEREKAQAAFKKIKAAYEAIESLDERAFRDTFGGTLGLSPERLRALGGDAFDAGTEDHFSDWSWFADAAESKKTAQSQSRDLREIESLFQHSVSDVFQSSAGAIIIAGDRLFWLPRGSRQVWPTYSRINSEVFGDWVGYLVDPRLPEGKTKIVIDGRRETIKMDDLTYYRNRQVNLVGLGERMKRAGFFLTEQKLNAKDLNIWNYWIFKEGDDYTVIAELDNYSKDGSYEYKMFVGRPGQMQPIYIEYIKSQRKVFVPSKNMSLIFSQSGNVVPYFDEVAGQYMGVVDISGRPLHVMPGEYNQGTKPIRIIPGLERKDVYKISLFQLLGEHVMTPDYVQTPLDPKFRTSARFHDEAVSLAIGHQQSTEQRHPVVVTQDEGAKQNSASRELGPRRPSEWRIMREVKDHFKDMAEYFDYPQGDRRQDIVRFLLLSGSLSMDELQTNFRRDLYNYEYSYIYLRFFGHLDWEAQKASFFILYEVFEAHKDHYPTMWGLANIFVRDVIIETPDLQYPPLQRLIMKIRSLRNDSLNFYLDLAFAKRAARTAKPLGDDSKIRLAGGGSSGASLNSALTCQTLLLPFSDEEAP